MSVPIMNSCCFCISPRAGLLTFIYLKLILQAMIMLFLTVIKVGSDDLVKENADADENVMFEFFNDVTTFVLYLTLVIILIELPFNISGLVGAHKGSLSWLNVYYYFSFFCVVLNIIGMVDQAVEGSYQIAIWVVIYTAINMYMLFVAKGEKTRLESQTVDNANKFGLPPSKGSPIKSGYAHV